MVVYLVIEPDAWYYGDRTVIKVFLTEKDAKEFIKSHSKKIYIANR